MPNGSVPGLKTPEWGICPSWPPDVFAVAGGLLESTGVYAQSRYTATWSKDWLFKDKSLTKSLADEGAAWRKSGQPSTEVRRLWKLFIDQIRPTTNTPQPRMSRPLAWADMAMSLLVISDEASRGFGFVPNKKRGRSEKRPLAEFLLAVHRNDYLGNAGLHADQQFQLPQHPRSICWMVPHEEVCVQPKTLTPQVGCTLRSFSHNLALLPPSGTVRTAWLSGFESREFARSHFNLLVLPFPYRVDGMSFREVEDQHHSDESSGGHMPGARFFRLEQHWLNCQGKKVTPESVAKLVLDLVKAAREESGEVHGVVMPETALTFAAAEAVANALADEDDVQMFVTGLLWAPRGGVPRNEALTVIYSQDEAMMTWAQSKHHRWRLDRGQIRRYHLGHVLDPRFDWWEKIDISDRTCGFYNFRDGAAMLVLVCEDLARIDPVQNVVRSVGPNLVIALLQDGPQIRSRWPARYATVLAEDPGCAVLTVTSIGMLSRSSMPGDPVPRQICLWKEPDGEIQELVLPEKHHALLLTLSTRNLEQKTLDGRADGNVSVGLSLTGVRAVSLAAREKNFGWL